MPSRVLNGQVAIVTGASQGIGKATALLLAEQGACVVLVARHHPNLEKVANDILSEGSRALPLTVDVTDSAQVRQMVEDTVNAFGRIDLLVCCVGRGLRKPLVETSDQEWIELMEANLTSTLYCNRAVLPQMRLQQNGAIINIASRAGRIAEPMLAAYSAVKHGVIGLTRALAAEEASNGIHVNAICPATVATERMKGILPNADQSKWLSPEQVAQAVLFLATTGRMMQGKTLDLF